jgi:hypothetical protein
MLGEAIKDEGIEERLIVKDISEVVEFQGYHTNQACDKSSTIPPEYPA